MKRAAPNILWVVLLGLVIGTSCKKIFRTGLQDRVYTNDSDLDGDGLPDLFEVLMGSDPFNPDTKGAGVTDDKGDEDGDGLTNYYEWVTGFNPTVADSCSPKFPKVTCGQGVKDGDKDLDGDGAPLAWEIKYKLKYDDPSDLNDLHMDQDQDGIANAEEWPDNDPTDAASPKAVYTAYDDDNDVAGRTNSVNVRATFSFCSGKETLILTEVNTKPEASDSRFVACKKDQFGYTVVLSSAAEGTISIYAWRKVDGRVLTYPVTTTMVMDTTAPTGSISAPTVSTTTSTIPVSVVYPTQSDYKYLALYHLTGTCPVTKLTGDLLSFPLPAGETTRTETYTGYATDSRHCYRVYFTDDVGNTSASDVAVNEVQSRTKSVPTACSGPSAKTCYPGQNASFPFTCDQSITGITDPNGSWPSGFSTTLDTPAMGNGSVGGTVGATAGTTNGTARINGDSSFDKTFSLTVLGTSPTTGDISAIVPTANTSISMVPSAGLDGTWACTATSVNLRPLMGNAADGSTTTADGAVNSTETNIPLLQYDNDCSTNYTAYVCPGSASLSGTTVTGALTFKWDYSKYDQGSYFVGVRNYVTLQGAAYLGTRKTGVVTIGNLGGEEPLTAASNIADAVFLAAPEHFKPQIAMLDSVSTGTDNIWGVVFPYNATKYESHYGSVRVKRTATSAYSATFTAGRFASTDVYSDTLFNSQSPTILATPGGRWVSLFSQSVTNGSANLIFAPISWNSSNSTPTAGTTIPLAAFTGNQVGSQITDLALSPIFSDADTGTPNRFGAAFAVSYVYVDTSTADFNAIYVSKLRSDPTTDSKANLINDTAWPDTNISNKMSTYIDSVRVNASLGTTTLDLVRLTQFGDYFYVGWRATTGDLLVSRIAAKSGSSPTVTQESLAAGVISSMNGSITTNATAYSADYGMAVGLDTTDFASNTTTNPVIGLLISQGAGGLGSECYFVTLRVSGGNLVNPRASNAFTQVSTGTTSCRNPSLYYDATANKFVAVYNKLGATYDTVYTEFKVTSANTFALPDEVVLASPSTAEKPRFMHATYSSQNKRVGVVRMNTSTSNYMQFDTYKVGE